MFSIEDILKATGATLVKRRQGVSGRISGVSIDTRTIKKGELFIAIKGSHFDGHDFIKEAIKKGAGCIAASSFKSMGNVPRGTCNLIKVKDTLKALGDIAAFYRQDFRVTAIGITGSNGKTTAKEITSDILVKRYSLLKNRGTENNLVGLPLTLLRLKKHHEVAILEMGTNHLGEIARLTEILDPKIGLITNIGPSHLRFLKDKEGVLSAKRELPDRLGRGSTLFLNGDDPLLSRLRPKCNVVRFGTNRENDFRAGAIDSKRSLSFTLNGRHKISTNLIGRHNIYNILAGIAASFEMGIDISLIKEALLNFKPSGMRMEIDRVEGIDIINDAYNSNPLSLECAIKTLSGLRTKGRRIIVSGDMLELGRKARFFHARAGRLIADSSINALITVGRLS